jgi:hypothetical protein
MTLIVLEQAAREFSRDLAALLEDKSVERTALGSRRHFAYSVVRG